MLNIFSLANTLNICNVFSYKHMQVWLKGSFRVAFSVWAHMDQLFFQRSRPDPMVGVSALVTATFEAMCDLSFLMFLCLYMFLCFCFLCVI